MDLTPEEHETTAGNVANTEKTNTEDTVTTDDQRKTTPDHQAQIQGIRGVRSQEKSSVTRSITKLNKVMRERGSRSLIRSLITKIEGHVQNADISNRKLYELLPEREHASVENWFVEVVEKADDAVASAYSHLDDREDEPPSFFGSVTHSKVNTSTSLSSSARVAKARRKAEIAKLAAKQSEEEWKRREREDQARNELELAERERRENLEQVKYNRERLAREESERRRVQEAKDLAAQAELDARLIEVETKDSDSECLKQRLRDFEDHEDPGGLELIGYEHLKHGNAREEKTNIKIDYGKLSPVLEEQKPKATPNSTASWIAKLPRPTDSPPTYTTQVPHQTLFHKSVPRLTLTKFDGDPLKWTDWSGMFHAIIHQTEMSNAEKMTHLQQTVVGKAKSEIAGLLYNGELYDQALKRLESRFGKPHIVVQAHLDKLAKTPPVIENDATSVTTFSNVLNNIVWTFKGLGYEDDLRASSNVRTAVEKLPATLSLKWNEHVVGENAQRPTLESLAKWLQKQAEAHELLPTKPKAKVDGRDDRRPRIPKGNGANRGGVNSFATHERTTESCPLGDGDHPVFKCKKFIEMNPDDRAETAKEANLCFSCLEGGHRSRECPLTEACGTDGCKKKHHKLLHLSKRVFGNQDYSEHTKLTSHTRQSSQVVLQVVPVILHGPAKNLKTYAMLDLGSTCSLIQNRIADELGLDGPQERMTLNGIQQRKLHPLA